MSNIALNVPLNYNRCKTEKFFDAFARKFDIFLIFFTKVHILGLSIFGEKLPSKYLWKVQNVIAKKLHCCKLLSHLSQNYRLDDVYELLLGMKNHSSLRSHCFLMSCLESFKSGFFPRTKAKFRSSHSSLCSILGNCLGHSV